MGYYEVAEQKVTEEEYIIRKALETIYEVRNLRHQKIKVK